FRTAGSRLSVVKASPDRHSRGSNEGRADEEGCRHEDGGIRQVQGSPRRYARRNCDAIRHDSAGIDGYEQPAQYGDPRRPDSSGEITDTLTRETQRRPPSGRLLIAAFFIPTWLTPNPGVPTSVAATPGISHPQPTPGPPEFAIAKARYCHAWIVFPSRRGPA